MVSDFRGCFYDDTTGDIIYVCPEFVSIAHCGNRQIAGRQVRDMQFGGWQDGDIIIDNSEHIVFAYQDGAYYRLQPCSLNLFTGAALENDFALDWQVHGIASGAVQPGKLPFAPHTDAD